MKLLSSLRIPVIMLAFCVGVFGQNGDDVTEAKLISVPDVVVTDEAKAYGLGGEVRVRVAIDAEGNVSSVEGVSGPGAVCSSITRPDVVAMRKAAADAAVNAKFSPATKNGSPQASTDWLRFTFPVGKVEGSKKDNRYYAGPVAVAGEGTGSGESKQLSGGVLNGKAESLPKPAYPPAARAVRASGAVQISVLIDEDGTVFSAESVSGHPLLRAAARNAACEAKFSPTTLEGRPVKVAGIITYNFVP